MSIYSQTLNIKVYQRNCSPLVRMIPSVTARNSLNKLSILLTYSHQCCTLTKYHTISKTIIHCKAQIKTAPTIIMTQPYMLEISLLTCGGKTCIWSICVELLMCCICYGQWELPNSVTKCCHMKSSVLLASKKTLKLSNHGHKHYHTFGYQTMTKADKAMTWANCNNIEHSNEWADFSSDTICKWLNIIILICFIVFILIITH